MPEGVSKFQLDLVALLPRLRRFAFALTRTGHDAEDLVQSAVERALRHQDSWQPETRLDSWMFKIIQNLWRDDLRAHRRRSDPIEEADDIVGEDGRTVTAGRLELADIVKAMDTLSEEQRAVIVLVAIDGQSYQDAANALGVPVGTVMSRLARARAALLARLSGGKS